MKYWSYILCFFYMLSLDAQTMHINIYSTDSSNAFTISVREGKYVLECDGEKYGEYKKNSIFFISKQGDQVAIRDKSAQIGLFHEVILRNKNEDGITTVRPVASGVKSNEYDDAVKFTVINNKLKAVNLVDLEKYIAGVIEAEGGVTASIEYYKAQAILIRTFTIKNIYKHAEEGFNLCDEVHCQAYHGRNTRNPEIYEATQKTAGFVVIDRDSILIMSPFHSSCGGQTSSAGIYWQTDLPYLQSVDDPFCRSLKNSSWQKEIPLTDWYLWLSGLGLNNPEAYCEYHNEHRDKFFIEEPVSVTLRQIREKFGLRSAFFDFGVVNNHIVFSGRGYGHGIGMCQIGAMEMANVGYTYVDIIHFYFQDVLLTDYRDMELHRY